MSVRHVEISEQVVNLGDEGNDDVDNNHVITSDDEDVEWVEVVIPSPRTVERNAMGEYLPKDGEKALTQQALSGPGPSTYTPAIELTKPMAPQHSIVGKVKDKKVDTAPGPKYDTSENMIWNKKTRTLKAKLETSPYWPKSRDHLTCSLGSAAYKVEYYNTGKHAPGYTIGSRFNEPIILGPPNIAVEPVDTKGFAAPGPSYAPFATRGVKKSFGLKYRSIHDKDIPGPAEYNIGNSHRGPQYSLGHKVRDQSAFKAPGPGSYEIKSTIGSGVATSIRGRQTIPSKYSVPSPNTYVLPDTFQDAPRHSMTYRAFETEVCETPGPANYRQICRETWKAPPEFSCRKQCKPGFPAILNYPEYGYYVR
ncbi:uncharacterized protein LOC114530532 [Dendronephthya gigantea]|uniref:uncharacterized protein LOC114530532 n=1 Tax=Dendronephthya gigantea TaxID=151771 RepID=UPI00106B803A|nr:uncharacterized protein LOC114530532 [Dendronephthya gigantea]